MKPPSLTDRFVRVTAYLSDADFGYENWHARQFGSGALIAGTPTKCGVLILCEDEVEQKEALAFLEDRRRRA